MAWKQENRIRNNWKSAVWPENCSQIWERLSVVHFDSGGLLVGQDTLDPLNFFFETEHWVPASDSSYKMVSSVPVIHAKKEKKPPTDSGASSAFRSGETSHTPSWFMESLSLFCCGGRTRGGDVTIWNKATHSLSQHYSIQLHSRTIRDVLQWLQLLWRFQTIPEWFWQCAVMKKQLPNTNWLSKNSFLHNVFFK